MKKNVIIGIVVFAVAAIIVYAAVLQPFFKFQKVNIRPEDTSIKEVVCDVSVVNPRGIPLFKNGDLVIESANCQQQYVSNCGRFGLFSDVGTLRLEAAGGLGTSTDVKIGEGSSQSYSLLWCGSKLTNSFNIKLFDENNNNIQAKEVKLV